MSQLSLAILFFFIYLIVYYVFGVLISHLLKLGNKPVHQLIYGMFFYQLVFFIFVMPLKFHIVPVDTIGRIWTGVVLVVCIAVAIWLHKDIYEGFSNWVKDIREHWVSSLVIFILIVGELLFVEYYGRLLGGNNQVWFVGWVSNAVAHNELMTYVPETGLAATSFNNDRYLCTFLDHSGVISKTFGIHPMVEVRTILTGVFILIQCLVIWELAKYLGKEKRDASVAGYIMYWSITNIMAGSQLLPGFYDIFRTYEGKAFVMDVSVPLLLLLLWKLYDEPDKWKNVWKSIIVMCGSMTYSLSMMFTYPFVLAAFTPFLIVKKEKRILRYILLMGAVSAVYFVVYYLGRLGKIDLTINR